MAQVMKPEHEQMTASELRSLIENNIVHTLALTAAVPGPSTSGYDVISATNYRTSGGQNVFMLVSPPEFGSRGSLIVGNDQDLAEWRQQGHAVGRDVLQLPAPDQVDVTLGSNLSASGSVSSGAVYALFTPASGGGRASILLGNQADADEWARRGLTGNRSVMTVGISGSSGSYSLTFSDASGERRTTMRTP